VVLNPDIFGFNEAAVLVTSRLVAFDYAVIEWLERVIFPCHHWASLCVLILRELTSQRHQEHIGERCVSCSAHYDKQLRIVRTYLNNWYQNHQNHSTSPKCLWLSPLCARNKAQASQEPFISKDAASHSYYSCRTVHTILSCPANCLSIVCLTWMNTIDSPWTLQAQWFKPLQYHMWSRRILSTQSTLVKNSDCSELHWIA